MATSFERNKLVFRSRLFLILLTGVSLILQFQWLHKTHHTTAEDDSDQHHGGAARVLEEYRDASKEKIGKLKISNNSTDTVSTTMRPREEEPDTTIKSPREEEPDFVVNPLCGGCMWTYFSKMKTCGQLIADRAKTDKVSLVEAAKRVIGNAIKSHKCKICLDCDDRLRRYWRPDRTAPRRIHRAVTHYLSSIPDDHRIPPAQLALDNEQLAQYLNQYPASKTSGRKYLFEYNPSIVQYPPNLEPLQINGESAAYIASYRVATQQACFPTNTTLALIGGDWGARPDSLSFLGIALLREDLTVITDGVFHPKGNFGNREDFRLFVLKGQLYLTTFRKLTPLWIGTKDQKPSEPKGITQPLPPLFPDNSNNQILEINMGKYFIPSTVDVNSVIGSAKNLNYFIDDNDNIQMEFTPPGNAQSRYQAHVVHPVHLDIQDCAGEKGSPKRSRYDYYNHSVTASTIPEYQSFYTMDEIELAHNHEYYESPFTTDRGSACCLEFTHPDDNNRTLFLGISHVKPPFNKKRFILKEMGTEPNQYLSRLFAFDTKPPYQTVAMSGYFCFSQFLQVGTVHGVDDNPLAHRPLHKNFKMGNMTLDCPVIHFISGMTRKVGDPSKIIIAYGLQDCTSWFIEVDLSEVVDLLFRGPSTTETSAETLQ